MVPPPAEESEDKQLGTAATQISTAVFKLHKNLKEACERGTGCQVSSTSYDATRDERDYIVRCRECGFSVKATYQRVK